MRKVMMMLGVVAALGLSNARTSNAEGMTFGLLGGAAIPMGDYGDAVGLGPMGGVFGDFGVTPQFALGLDIVGNFHGLNSDLKDELEAFDPEFDFNFTVIQFGAHAKWRPAPTGFWAQGGLGMYQGSAKVESSFGDSDDSETKFGFNVGAGFDFPMSSSMNLGLSAIWHNVPDTIEEFDSSGPTGDTVSAQWVGVGATLTFLTAPR